jgi:hypothetical protein
MKGAVFVLIVAVLAMAVWNSTLSTKLTRLEKSVAELDLKSTQKATATGLELQAKCAEQARKQFIDGGYLTMPLTGYESHYNSDLNKCAIQINSIDGKTAGRTRSVFDAFEGKEYGSVYTVRGDTMFCTVKLPSGESKRCQSHEEFDNLVKVYMEGGR